MKRFLTTLLILLPSLFAEAETVSSGAAREVAAKFMRSSALSLVWDGENSGTKAPGQTPAFYVFNCTEGGWVIVSAEDCSDPILGYSRTGQFVSEGMPSNLVWWLGGLRNTILEARSLKVQATEEVKSLWIDPVVRTKAERGVELETAKWGQGSPYNNLCPRVSGESSRAVTGCVATSACIFLRYIKWPEKGFGTLPEYYTASKKHRVPSLDISEHVYEWDNMPLKYNNSSTDEQKTQVARLMHDVGVALQLDYSSSGTAGYSQDIAMVFSKYFSFENTGYECFRANYLDTEWLRLLEAELDAGYPILYGGSGRDGGHAFIADGYDSSDKLRINWGWDGSNDGYYTLDLKIPGRYTFGDYQSAMFGMRPAATYGDHSKGQNVELLLEAYQGYNGITLTSGEIVRGAPFTLSVGVIWNETYGTTDAVDYNGYLKVALVDYRGDVKEFISDQSEFALEGGYGDCFETKCTVKGALAPGDRICIYFLQTDGSWQPMHYTHVDGVTVGELGVVDGVFIAPPAECRSGELYYFNLIPGRRPIKAYTWYYDGVKQDGACVLLTPGVHTVSAKVDIDSYEENISASFSIE